MKKEIFNIIKINVVYLILALLLFLLILIIKINYIEEITSFDLSITSYINNNIQSHFVTKLMLSISFLGSFTALSILILASFFILNNKKISLVICINLLVVHLFNKLLKYIYNRPRPEFILIEETGTSLPSGHAMCAMAFYGLLIYLNTKFIINKIQKIIFNTILTILILAIGFSRIYLNVHYFTDVIIGYIFGFLSLLTFINIIKYKKVKL